MAPLSMLALLVAAASSTRPLTSVGSCRACGARLDARAASRAAPRMRQLPADVKDLVDELRVATQAALSSRLSRIDVELPLGMGLLSGDKAQDVHASSRELARIFCEMFSQLEATTVVAFKDDALASAARQAWGAGSAARAVALCAGAGKKRGPASASGFGAAASAPGKAAKAAGVPAGTEIVFAVGPFDTRALSEVERLCGRFGKGTLIVLLNAHLDSAPFGSAAQRDFFDAEFERVFCFRPVRTATEPPEQLLVYRAHPQPWTLARMRASGRPTAIAEQDARFSREDIERALARAAPDEPVGPLDAIGSFFSQIGGK
ncbi:hypothetical protein KFE25_005193 [Diacronema lutheri]|uniref:DUF1995 domain-containing protein n=1 Tax=Diacronema lutheri TaxID=2081491 RepID=A0A8J6C4I4_DIALT|nr:hypothetical protein KFE25_005193 [Diacronema lutheri]